MSKEEKKKLYKEFENDKEASFIYFKAHKIYLLCFIGVVYSIIATIFDIVKDVKYYAYLMDAFLFIFCIIFGIKMSKFKKNEFNKYLDSLDVKAFAEFLDGYVLCCYEKSTDFCHRHLVAEWLIRNGIKCEEYKFT